METYPSYRPIRFAGIGKCRPICESSQEEIVVEQAVFRIIREGEHAMQQNEMRLEFDSRSCNEAFARVTVAAFMTQLNPTLEEVADVKTAVSEAVTNAIIHGYEGRVEKITISCQIEGEYLLVEVIDKGKGIADVKRAMEPLFTTKAECDRAGMGFAFMEAFMDTLDVQSAPDCGTTVRMSKRIARTETGSPQSRSFPAVQL